MSKPTLLALAGAAAGAMNGLFGAGGGMILVPMLSASGVCRQEELFGASLAIVAPMCLVTLTVGAGEGLPWGPALPFLIGGLPGGILAARLKPHIPVAWLHRLLGAMIIYGGVRYLC